MENDDAFVGRILTRREAISAGFALMAGGALARMARAGGIVAATQASVVASPAVTEGPFFVDEKLKRSDLTSGTDRASVVNGMPLLLTFRLYKLADQTQSPMKDVFIDVWHCDAAGAYSDESNPMNHQDTSGQNWLRGYQITDESGLATFGTIIPGWYRGRTPHIHFKARQFSSSGNVTAEFTSQLFFHPQDLAPVYAEKPYALHGNIDQANARDGIFSEKLADGTTAGSHLLLDLKKNAAKSVGFASEFSIFVTDDEMRPGRRHGHGGPGGPPPGGPPPGGFGPGGRPPGPPPGDFDGPPPRE
jgi:protocatechuate 3,4-dioxygenase beta subunit